LICFLTSSIMARARCAAVINSTEYIMLLASSTHFPPCNVTMYYLSKGMQMPPEKDIT
jgi:hypothetical protein